MRTTKAQTSLRMRAFVKRSLPARDEIQTCFIRNFEILVSLCSWAGWFEHNLARNSDNRVSPDDAWYIYSTTKETHQSLLGEILENRIKRWKYMYTIVLNNQFCINTLNKLKILLKSVQAVRQCLDKGSFSKMTSFSLENEYLVLV